jgi:hypothetical protein
MRARVPPSAVSALVGIALLAGLFGACDGPATPPAFRSDTNPASSGPVSASGVAADSAQAPRFVAKSLELPAAERVVALGDVHGDLTATKAALELAGAIDGSGAWVGGTMTVVQVGDQLDRGDDDRAILDYFEKLRDDAKKAGGRFVSLNGNHEIMNAAFDFRYVTEGAFSTFSDIPVMPSPKIDALPEAQRPRAAAFLPGGPYAMKLAAQPLVAIVGDSVFVHGGLSMKHLEYGLEKMDEETRAWLRGERPTAPQVVTSEDGPIWMRAYSAAPGSRECGQLDQVLDALGKKRLVMGHTPQRNGANAACGGRAWRIDVGLARHYGGPVQALEIKGDSVTVLKR